MPKLKSRQQDLLPRFAEGPMKLVSEMDLEMCLRHKEARSDFVRGNASFIQDLIWKTREVGSVKEVYPHNVFRPITRTLDFTKPLPKELVHRFPEALGVPDCLANAAAALLIGKGEWMLDAVGMPGVTLYARNQIWDEDDPLPNNELWVWFAESNELDASAFRKDSHKREESAFLDPERVMCSLVEHFGIRHFDAGESLGPYFEDTGRSEAEKKTYGKQRLSQYKLRNTYRDVVTAHVRGREAATRREVALNIQTQTLQSV